MSHREPGRDQGERDRDPMRGTTLGVTDDALAVGAISEAGRKLAAHTCNVTLLVGDETVKQSHPS